MAAVNSVGICSQSAPSLPPLGVAVRGVIRQGAQLLLLRRSTSRSHEPGLWELPGGKMSYGETLTGALTREISEETSLKVSVGAPFTTWHFIKDPFWVTGITFVCEHGVGEVRLSDEHSDFRWVTVDEALRMQLSSTISEQIRAFIDWERHWC